MALIVHEDTQIIKIGCLGDHKVVVFYGPDEIKFLAKENDTDLRELEECYLEHNGFVDNLMGPNGVYTAVGLNNMTLRVVIHESVHAAHCVMDCRGIPISMENTEIEAYLVDYIANSITNHLERRRHDDKIN